jgi:GNAT superfamily N-acetyltransferase
MDMRVDLRPIRTPDVPEVVKGWNPCLPYDKIDEDKFKGIVLDDPNHEDGASIIAISRDRIVGFISAVAREGLSGADGRGRPGDIDYGYIKGFFVLKDFRRQGIGTKLLYKATEYIRSKSKSNIRVIAYTGRYFFPGVDLRYEPAIKFFESKGFKKDDVIDDMDLDLINFRVSDYHKEARRRMTAAGVRVEEYNPAMLDKMRDFVDKLKMIPWFPEGWEKDFKEKGDKFVAVKGDEIVGWASYWPGKETAGFGPIAVLKSMRGNGIGSCLLLECVLKMREYGADRVFAGWTNTPFYLPNGWNICRQYAVFEKGI